MRLFVAVDPSEAAIDAARRTMSRLQRQLERSDGIRWAPFANLHLTVRVIGEVAEEDAPRVIESVAAPLAVGPFRMRLDRCRVFPKSGPPRVIWLGVGEGAAGLLALHDELDARLGPLGFPGEKRPFAAHLTLARVSPARGGAAIRNTVEHATVDPASTEIDQAALYRSHLSPRGARYEVVARIPLAGERG
jgi:2'-5' RNA ligase